MDSKMNERIRQLWEESTVSMWPRPGKFTAGEYDYHLEKFAELIVRECIKTIEYRAPGQMGKEGEGWTNGYDDGLKTGAWLLKEHFGVKE
jgi:hypothetical protein